MSFVPCFIYNSFVYIFVWYASYTEWLDWYQWIKKIKSLAVFTHFSITSCFHSCRNWTNKCIKTNQTDHMTSNDDPDYQDELQPSSSKTSNDAVSSSFYLGSLNRLQ